MRPPCLPGGSTKKKSHLKQAGLASAMSERTEDTSSSICLPSLESPPCSSWGSARTTLAWKSRIPRPEWHARRTSLPTRVSSRSHSLLPCGPAKLGFDRQCPNLNTIWGLSRQSSTFWGLHALIIVIRLTYIYIYIVFFLLFFFVLFGGGATSASALKLNAMTETNYGAMIYYWYIFGGYRSDEKFLS